MEEVAHAQRGVAYEFHVLILIIFLKNRQVLEMMDRH